MISKWTSSVQEVFHRRGRKRGGIARRQPEQHAARAVERLEDRRVMAFDLVSAYSASDSPFFVAGGTAQTLTEAPQQVTLRFSPGVKIDPATLGSISIVRSGGAGDLFGNANDVSIVPGSILVNDLPNQNEVVIRFADTLPDDSYRITVAGGSSGLKTLPGDTMVATRTFDVRLDLGAFVVSVVPQPVSRVGDVLTQNRDQIAVFFNANDRLNVASAQRAASYCLFEVDATTGLDKAGAFAGGANFANPATVSYDATTGRALLNFAPGVIANDKLYRLQVGAAEAIVSPPGPVAEGSDANSSFGTAKDLGTLTSGGATVTGMIAAQTGIPNPASGVPNYGDLKFPTQPGSLDEPGHRDVPDEIGNDHGDANRGYAANNAIRTQEYNFRSDYGVDPQGNQLFNAITETQKQRAREIFELYSRYTGVRFIETANSGITVVTGDMRALDPNVNTAPAGLTGLVLATGNLTAIMDSTENWGDSEYSGSWFRVAMHEIGHALGLAHSYDLNSIMGAGLTGEPVFPGDYDTIHLAQFFPANGSDIDVYKFALTAAGRLSAETVVGRPGQAAVSKLDSLLTLYREDPATGRREIVARNDDYYGRDSFVGLDLVAGTYYIAVSSTGNDRFNPEISDSGYGGRSDGAYQLKLGFQPTSTSATTIVDASNTLLDGDRDGKPGGAFNFWFNTAATAKTVFVDKVATATPADGTLAKPYATISAALAAVNAANAATPGSKTIVRIVGNATNAPYLIGTTLGGQPLADGATFNVPTGVTVMIDEGAVFKLRAAIIDVGSSSAIVSRAGASLQVLGTPTNNVQFTSYHDDSIGGNSDGAGPPVSGGQWGGIVLRSDSDFAATGSGTKTAFVNSISQASVKYGGGQVFVDSQLDSFAPVQLENTRPTLAFNTIQNSAGAAISATPDSFEDSNGRIGPEIRGNRLTANSINGLFVKVRTPLGGEPDRLDVPARLRSTDIVYVLQDNLLISGGAGGYVFDGVNTFARKSGRLAIDPGVVVKLQGARIELERGTSQLIAEGTSGQRVVFTSLGDNRFGAGGTFDTNGNLPDVRKAGDWGGIVLNAGSKASIDYSYIAFGGGQTPIEGTLDRFNVIETHQGDLRLAHSRIENNAAGTSAGDRTGRGANVAATVFVRGAQPVILGNDFRDNLGAVVSVNANSLNDSERPDPGRSTGAIGRDARYDDNRGVLVRDNRLSYSIDVAAGRPAGGATAGMDVRGGEITVEGVWDDSDIVHVLQSEIWVQNFHTATGVRLMSQTDSSLVVKLAGPNAGFTAAGYGLDITDRIGGTVQVVGQPGYPVILTSLKDDSVGASLDPLGQLTKDTNTDGTASTPSAGDWRSLKFLPMSNDRNVSVIQEVEKAAAGWAESNSDPTTAQALGVLAPNFKTGVNTSESAQEKSGDDNRRLGFEVHGAISWTSPGDVDVYSFSGYAGSEVWIDIDKTSTALDSMVELLDASGKVLARSADAHDGALSAATTLDAKSLDKDAWRGGDFYTVNPRDGGMRVTLPGIVGSTTPNQYFIRIRSQPRYTAATSQATYEAELADPTKLSAGATSGAYELRVRLQQRDEKPGSTVRYADIRFPQVGIDVQGLPRNSLLTGETGESTAANDLFANAQQVGNLLQADHNTISIAGRISSATDVDWYTFTLNYEQLQNIGGVNSGSKSWSTVFDLDYGDGLQGDFSLFVFDATGKLIYTGRDSDVASDQPGAGQGNDFDDLSRGSIGKLDPFIGSVQMPAGSATASGAVSPNGAVDVDVTKQTRYYVAVASNRNLPTALDATFKDAATNSLIRLEPISSVQRIVEDHIGFTGYSTNGPVPVPPTTGPLIDTVSSFSLSTHVTPFTLSDVTLFVSTGRSLVTVDAMRGIRETVIEADYNANQDIGDLVMRSDGRLYAYAGLAGNTTAVGRLDAVDTGTGTRTAVGTDNISNPPAATTQTDTNLSPNNGAAGTTARFQLSQTGITTGSVAGTISYAGDTWVITTVAGALVFTPVGTPSGTAAPVSGFVTPTGSVFVTWNQSIAFASATLTATYSFTGDPQALNSDTVDAIAWQRTGAGAYNNLFYSVREGARSRLYKADPANGSATAPTPNPNGYGLRGVIQDPLSSLGNVTGMAYVGATLYGVDTKGYLFTINVGTGAATLIDLDPTTPLVNDPIAGVQFAGLTIGPQNLYGGALKNALFAIDTSGTLYAFDTAGNRLQVFDSNGDGVADATSSPSPGLAGVTGLAFSPLDVNLWHTTTRRATDAGHGINDAPDFTRATSTTQNVADGLGIARAFEESKGGVSMYFGLEQYVGSGKTPYLNYQSARTQYGVLDPTWQQDLSTNSVIPNTYNLPGGAYGSLTTNSFDLTGYTYTDKPTLYFNYWLQTEGVSGKVDTMRDSARVFVSIDGGATWDVIATNNSVKSASDTSDAELPAFASVSSKASNDLVIDNQHVQELHDTGSWRQARVDLGRYARQPDVRLRFDFSTAGELDATQNWANNTTVTTAVAGLPDVEVADVTGIVEGMNFYQNGGLSGLTVVSVDPTTNTVTLDGVVTAAAGDAVAFVLPNALNGIAGLAGTTGNFSDPQRGQNNQFEGFYIDDIVVGFAERGEMVTGAAAGQTSFFDLATVGTPTAGTATVPAQSLAGTYQLEIRRGTTYGTVSEPLTSSVSILQQVDTNDDLVASNASGSAPGSPFATPWIGDANTPRQQGQFLIQNNIISSAGTYGISIDAGLRDPITNAPVPGVARNLPVLNNSRLVPGVVVVNNVVSTSGTAGILFSGDLNSGTGPTAAVPYGRIVNNTIYGGTTPKGTGVVVTENAGPTLMNNLFANLTTGVSVDPSSQLDGSLNQRTVITTSAFAAVGTQVSAGATQSQALTLTSDPFVNAASGNFYLRAGTPAIDSSLNSLADRNEYVVVTSPIGVPQSPIIAPDRDLFGQLRGDDPSQASQPGLGTNVFKDRGAIDRVDFFQPSAAIAKPQDGSPDDLDLASDSVVLKKDARSQTAFELQLSDTGVGIDRSTVTSDAFTLSRNGTPLVLNTDYVFTYLETTNRVVFQAASVFPLGAYVIRVNQQTVGGVARNMISDLAGNALLGNKSDGTASYGISLADVPDAPGKPAGTPGDQQVVLAWTSPASDGNSAITDYTVQFSSDGGTTWLPFTDGVAPTTGATVTGLVNDTAYVFRVKATNLIGESGWSPVSDAVKAGVVPGVPTALAASGTGAVSGQVVLTWTAPVAVGNPALNDYVVESSTDAGATWTVFNDGVKSTTGATLTGLTDGQTYQFRVKSRNTIGDSGYTATVSAMPGVLPGAPTLLAGVPSTVGGVALTWTAPGTLGSPVLTDYVVQYKVSGQLDSAYVTFIDGVQSTTGATVTGLTSGTQYVFRVKAVNVVGDSPWATISGTVSPGVVPGVPTALAASGTGAVSGQVVLTWTAPVAVGNPALNDYVVESSTDAGATWTVFNDGVKSTTGATLTGLTDGVSYQFRVKSRNTIGDSGYAGPVSAMPGVLPGKPTSLAGSANAAARSVALTWTAPGTLGSPTLTDYVVEYKVSGQLDSAYVTFNDGVQSTTGATVTGLANATTYVFRVRAVNALGNGPTLSSNDIVLPATVPSAPQNLVVASVASGSATLTWTAPVDNGGAAISDYVVQYKLSSQPDTAYVTFRDGERNTTGATVTGLTNGTSYIFRVAAKNSAGSGAYVVSAPATPWPQAPAPTRLTGTPGNGLVSLVWTAPTVVKGTSILDYIVQFKLNGQPDSAYVTFNDGTSALPRAAVTGLANGSSYVFRVAAITTGNTVGLYSSASPILTPFQVGAVPAAPTDVVTSQGARGTMNLTWTAPPANGGGAASGYVVQYALAGTNTWATLNVTGTTATVSRLIIGRIYNFRVAARNLAGLGAYSTPVSATA